MKISVFPARLDVSRLRPDVTEDRGALLSLRPHPFLLWYYDEKYFAGTIIASSRHKKVSISSNRTPLALPKAPRRRSRTCVLATLRPQKRRDLTVHVEWGNGGRGTTPPDRDSSFRDDEIGLWESAACFTTSLGERLALNRTDVRWFVRLQP